MSRITIHIKELNDPTPALELTPDEVTEGDLEKFFILEAGTVNGNTSVAFLITTPDGQKIWAETTGLIFENLASALKGANQRFELKRKQ